MTIHVNIGEAKTRLSELIAAAVRGEDVVVAHNGSPRVRLVPHRRQAGSNCAQSVSSARRRSVCGGKNSKGTIRVSRRSKLTTPISTSASGGSLAFLIDTHVLIWAVEGSWRLSSSARKTLTDPANVLYVSAVTAREFADLRARGRLPIAADFGTVARQLSIRLLDLPAELWHIADSLPNLHGDPTDRMLIAHALHAELVLITADVTMQSYPVRSLW